jgi:hypothetical protein
MIVPDGVMICGIVTDVKVIDDEFTQNGYIYSKPQIFKFPAFNNSASFL